MGFWAATSGTWWNLLAVLLGSLGGAGLGRQLPAALVQQWQRWLGAVTLLMGLAMAQPLLQQKLVLGARLPALLPALLVLVAGVAIGHAIDLQGRLARWLRRLSGAPNRAALDSDVDSSDVDSGVTAELDQATGAADPAGVVSGAFVLFCIGPLTLLGCLRNGALGDPSLLLVKSSLDLVSSTVLASSVGLVLAWVSVPLALLQLSLSLLGAALSAASPAAASEPALLFTAALGGLLVIALALELLELPHPSVTNALPALALAPAIGWALQS